MKLVLERGLNRMTKKEINKNMIRDRAPSLQPISNEQYLLINKDNRRLAEEFLSESTHLSPNSISQYKSGLTMFLWWVHETFGEEKRISQIKNFKIV